MRYPVHDFRVQQQIVSASALAAGVFLDQSIQKHRWLAPKPLTVMELLGSALDRLPETGQLVSVSVVATVRWDYRRIHDEWR